MVIDILDLLPAMMTEPLHFPVQEELPGEIEPIFKFSVSTGSRDETIWKQYMESAMKKLNPFLVAFLLIITSNAWADQHVAMIKNVSKNVQIKRISSMLEARKGLQLVNSDIIYTKANGHAGIIFLDGTTITIGPDSEFKIKNYVFKPNTETYDFSIYLKKGSALFNSGKIGKLSPESVDLSTPRATVGIRGTRFIIKVQ